MRRFNIKVNGVAYDVEVEELKDGAPAPAQTAAPAAPRPRAAAPAAPAAPKVAVKGGEQVKAPMPGNILDIKIKEGDKVKNGEVLMILEAMKMENEIVSPSDGTVTQILAAKGAAVNSGDVLCVLG